MYKALWGVEKDEKLWKICFCSCGAVPGISGVTIHLIVVREYAIKCVWVEKFSKADLHGTIVAYICSS